MYEYSCAMLYNSGERGDGEAEETQADDANDR